MESIAFIYVGRKWCLELTICPNAHFQMSIYTSLPWYCGNSTELEKGDLRPCLFLIVIDCVTPGKELEFSGHQFS